MKLTTNTNSNFCLIQFILLLSLLTSSLFVIVATSSSAFTIPQVQQQHHTNIIQLKTTTKQRNQQQRHKVMSMTNKNNNPNHHCHLSTLRLRGGGGSSPPVSANAPLKMSNGGGGASGSSVAVPAAASSSKKIRITAFDSIRFFLIVGIVFGHFISFASPSPFLLRLFSQHNVLVGAFFALSGYVTAYTTTENKQYAVSPKVLSTPKQQWILSKVFGYYPLHLLVLLLFSPMFIFVDMTYNGIGTCLTNGLLSVTLTQAYFPNTGAEVWNAPTWFLSALTLATAIMPYCLPSIAKLTQTGLVKTGFWIYMIYLLPKLGYCKDTAAWAIAEGVTNPKLIPNLSAFNTQRFSPLYNIAEVLLGVIACRIVMLDGVTKEHKTNALSTVAPLGALLGFLYARAIGLIEINDLLARSIIFVPIFLRFLMAAHRNTVASNNDPIVSLLSSKLLVSLGSIVFPIFVVHGPLGQVFYKKLIAAKLFGQVLKGPQNFALYLATTVVTAWILQKAFLENKTVSKWSQSAVNKLSTWF